MSLEPQMRLKSALPVGMRQAHRIKQQLGSLPALSGVVQQMGQHDA